MLPNSMLSPVGYEQKYQERLGGVYSTGGDSNFNHIAAPLQALDATRRQQLSTGNEWLSQGQGGGIIAPF